MAKDNPGWIPILRPGVFTDANGQQVVVTREVIDELAATYNPELSEAPHVVGHPKSNAPAYGWVDKVKVVGDTLLQRGKQFADDFKTMVNEGRFKKRSLSYYRPSDANNPLPGKYYIKHVGWLGAQPPAVKGLANVSLSDTDGVSIELSEKDLYDLRYKLPLLGRVLRRIKNHTIEKEGLEVADNLIHDFEIRELEDVPDEATKTTSGFAFSDPSKEDSLMGPKMQADLDAQKKRNEALEAENKQLKADRQAAELAERNRQNHEYVTTVLEKKIVPGQQAAVVNLLNHLAGIENDQPVALSDGGEEKTTLAHTKSFLESLPEVDLSEEVATGDRTAVDTTDGSVDYPDADPERVKMHKDAVALSEKEGISYSEAIQKINR